MVPYAIVAPDEEHAHTSAGVRALHVLAGELRARGHEARVGPLEDTANPGDWITVYPETVYGNPLHADKVVRWTMNVPGLLGGDKTYAPDECVWTWHESFYPGAPLLTVPTIERDLFYADDTPKTHDTAYYGKGKIRGVERVPLTRHMAEINRNRPPWPPTRENLADLLRSTRTLYTYDDCTALVGEALLCGCRVMLLPEGRELAEADTFGQMSEHHAARIDAFVAATQERWG